MRGRRDGNTETTRGREETDDRSEVIRAAESSEEPGRPNQGTSYFSNGITTVSFLIQCKSVPNNAKNFK